MPINITGGSYTQSQLYDPWFGDVVQSFRIRAYCFIQVAGIDVTSRLDPHLISVHIIDGPSLECVIELDDRDASLPLPPVQAPVLVYLGWINNIEQSVNVFDGVIMSVESGFARKQGGRRMWVHASGYDDLGTKIKEPMDNHLGDGAPPGQMIGPLFSFDQFAQSVAAAAGATAAIHGPIGSTQRDYWHQNGESASHLFDRLASDLGAWWRVQNGNVMVMAQPGWILSGAGTQFVEAPTVQAVWGHNLIGWRVVPLSTRPTWEAAKQQYYDHITANWKQIVQQFDSPQPWAQGKSNFATPAPAPNAQVAGQQNDANSMLQRTGSGRIIINGEPQAKWNGTVVVKGARPGVDGAWRIVQAEHVYSRQGYVTWLDVWPITTAGDDTISSAWDQNTGTSQNSQSSDGPQGEVTIGPITVNPPGS